LFLVYINPTQEQIWTEIWTRNFRTLWSAPAYTITICLASTHWDK